MTLDKVINKKGISGPLRKKSKVSHFKAIFCMVSLIFKAIHCLSIFTTTHDIIILFCFSKILIIYVTGNLCNQAICVMTEHFSHFAKCLNSLAISRNT